MKNTMRKFIFVATILVLLILTLCACGEKDVYSTMNDMLKKDYSSLTLNVETTLNGYTLTSTYSVAYGDVTVVNYTCQEFAIFDVNSVPDSFITTKQGSANIVDGKIVSTQGDAVDLPQLTGNVGLDFKGTSWTETNTSTQGGKTVFSGTASNAKGFLGNTQFDGRNLKVVATYTSQFDSIVITYTSANGASVKLTYTFA